MSIAASPHPLIFTTARYSALLVDPLILTVRTLTIDCEWGRDVATYPPKHFPFLRLSCVPASCRGADAIARNRTKTYYCGLLAGVEEPSSNKEMPVFLRR